MNFIIRAGRHLGGFGLFQATGRTGHKIFLTMKLTAILIFLCCFHVSAKVFSQEINLSERNAPLEKVMQKVRKQSGYSFIFDVSYLKKAVPVNADLRGKSLEESLKVIFKDQPFDYEIKGKTIVLSPKAAPSVKGAGTTDLRAEVTGKVTDEKGNSISGATVSVKGSNRTVVTDSEGIFRIQAAEGDVLLFSYVGFQSQELVVGAKTVIDVRLKEQVGQLEAVSVVSTGYQTLPKERATGSFQVIDNATLNRRVSTNVLDKLNGITTGFYFRPNFTPSITTNPANKNIGVTIRGVSTFKSSTDPLIVLDNFPYEGEINNINPNDIESITILKDAAAASIWGARSGNGVIVITTKKGRKNEKMKISLNSNFTVAAKPDLSNMTSFMSSTDYIGVEQLLFNQGFFNSDLTNTTARPTVSPAVEIMAQLRAGTISSDQANAQLNVLRGQDVRNDFDRYVYQKATLQQYSLGIQGGGENITYALSAGFDDNKANLIGNNYSRFTLSSNNTYSPVKNLELTLGLNYSQNTTAFNNQFAYGSYANAGGKYGYLYPYARLADDNGNALSIPAGFRESYLNEVAAKGFLDWRYRPLDEINNADNTTKIRDVLTRVGVKYQIIPQLSAEVNYQNEWQTIDGRNYQNQDSYYTRNLINRYSVYNSATKTFTYNFPLGSILSLNNYDWKANNVRGQLNFSHSISKHNINAIVGSELRELSTTGTGVTLYGYDDQFGTANNSLNYQATYPTNPTGSALLPGNSGSVAGTLNRYVSYYANLAYEYDEKYTISLSGRKDGANLFGAKTNDKITPLWSSGIGWNISKENFYHSAFVPYLKLRATYGFNGNTYQNGTAYLTGRYATDPITGVQYIGSVVAPNPELKWERVKNINYGLDFRLAKNIITGTIEYYHKNGEDLIQPTAIAPQTGFATYTANVASTRTSGWDILISSSNFNNRFKWNTSFLFSAIKDKVVRYDAPITNATITNPGGVVGEPLFGLFAYKWAGINPANGNPRGYLNGKISEDYAGIINNYSPDSLIYVGSQRPTKFGSLRNDFSFKGFNLSVNVVYELGYVFRKPSVNLNYTAILTTGASSDYANRWQKTGDENITSVPSLVYPNNANRNTFYQYSEARIQSGDNIRLQDIRLGYDFSQALLKNHLFRQLQVYAYANNVGIIWRKNKYGIDPDFIGAYSNPFSLSLGLTANF